MSARFYVSPPVILRPEDAEDVQRNGRSIVCYVRDRARSHMDVRRFAYPGNRNNIRAATARVVDVAQAYADGLTDMEEWCNPT